MTGIINIPAEYRKNKVETIIRSIKKAFDEDVVVDYEMLVNACSFDFGASRRHVVELINTALSQFNHEIIKQDGKKVIKNAK